MTPVQVSSDMPASVDGRSSGQGGGAGPWLIGGGLLIILGGLWVSPASQAIKQKLQGMIANSGSASANSSNSMVSQTLDNGAIQETIATAPVVLAPKEAPVSTHDGATETIASVAIAANQTTTAPAEVTGDRHS